jgi:hypothetical protein
MISKKTFKKISGLMGLMEEVLIGDLDTVRIGDTVHTGEEECGLEDGKL